MVKKITTLCLCIALGSTVEAKNDAFIGLELGYGEVQGDTYTAGGLLLSNNTVGNDLTYGFRIGAQSGEWRTTFLYSYQDDIDTDQNIEMGLFMVDYFFMGDKSSMLGKIKPYLGGNLGYANYESTRVDDSTSVYGGQAGIVVDMMTNINLDLSYRHAFSGSEQLNHVSGFIFGMNYIY